MDLSNLKTPEEKIEHITKCNHNMFSPESIKNGTELFSPRPTDIFVTTPPKCGTTWVMQICHALRTQGSMDFDEITCVVPWDEGALECGQDLDVEQVANPRVFKSHCPRDKVAKGAKYIYVARNPGDVLVSFYHFLIPYFKVSVDDIPFEVFSDLFFFGAKSSHGFFFNHLLGWWEVRDDPNVLWLFFEDLKEDLPQCVEKISKFMGIELTDELKSIVLENSSFEFMKKHSRHFDDHFVRNTVLKKLGMETEEGFSVGKVRAGGGKTNYKTSEEIQKKLQQHWDAVLTEKTGCADYQQFRKSVSSLVRNQKEKE